MAGRKQDGSVATKALRRIQGWGRGRVFVPTDLLDLGPRGTVDTTMHRLARAQVIRQLARGLYDYPKLHERFGPLMPLPGDIAKAVARSTGESIALSDATAANVLGLSTQVPARPVYLTSGASRTLTVGNLAIRFKRTAPSRMVGGDTRAGLVLRALRYLGSNGINDSVIEHLHSILDDTDRNAIKGLRRHAPSWMQPTLDMIVRTDQTKAA